MTTAGGKESAKGPSRKAKKDATSFPVTYNKPIVPAIPTATPTERLEGMTRGRVEALEGDKRQLQAEVRRLQGRIDQLGPENSRLAEALANAESNHILATILVGGGGFAVSYATFVGKAASVVMANASAGCLLAGIAMMGWQALRARRGR